MKRKSISILLILAMIGFLLAGCGGQQGAAETADKVIIGNIYTADEEGSTAQAVAIKGGVYQYVGDEEGVQTLIGEDTEVLRLDEGMVLPGFVEAHAHGSEGGVGYLFEVNLYEGTSAEEYLAMTEAFIGEHPELSFICGAGWINGYFPTTGPSKEALDEISGDLPMVLISGDHHSVWANSKAIEMAGVTAETPDVPGGVIERDPETGMPTGTFREAAQDLIKAVIPEYSVEQYKQGILAYQEEVMTYGITAYFEPMVQGNLLTAYNELDETGELKLRVFGGYRIDPEGDPLAEIDECAALAEASEGGDFELTTIKIFTDGVVEGGTAYLLEDYANRQGFRGEALWDQELLNQVCAKADQQGIQIHIHAIGDASVRMAVDAICFAEDENGNKEGRHAITHLQVVAPEEIQRMAEYKIIAVTNPYWFCKEPGYFYELEVPFLGEARANAEYPMKDFFDAGVLVTAASDFPVTMPSMPLGAIQTGVIRCDRFADPETLQNPGQRVSVEQMIQATTANGAYENFAEEKLGSIEEGKTADLILLSADITSIDPATISSTEVQKTMRKGVWIFEK